MRLSEAMRLGSMALPPVHGPVFDTKDGEVCAGCAIGAALFAVRGHAAHAEVLDAIRSGAGSPAVWKTLIGRYWPWTIDVAVNNPVTGHTAISIASAIIHLFESSHWWTREQIADWVETIEAQHGVGADVGSVSNGANVGAPDDEEERRIGIEAHGGAEDVTAGRDRHRDTAASAWMALRRGWGST